MEIVRRLESAGLAFPVVSFEAFARLVEGNVDEYNSWVLNEGAPVSVKVVPCTGAKERIVKLYRGVNVLFGQKGTGKTKLIESIEQGLREQGQNAALYRSSKFSRGVRGRALARLGAL